ncbi:MAG: tRNA uridine-5-carboxymethylaminomethyl(34) synthesis GTPase MnmE, partial [Pseudomonadota bacterium]
MERAETPTAGPAASQDTIYALSTAPGRSGVAIIRISGPNAFAMADRLTRQDRPTTARLLTRVTFVEPEDQAFLDDGMMAVFPAPRSFTGEEVVECHIHGGIATTTGMLSALAAMGLGALAGPGEFTRRAVLNGKMDLIQAEGLGDLIDAETQSQRTLALRALGADHRRLVDGWKDALADALALGEAPIEFEEEDIPEALERRVRTTCVAVHRAIQDNLSASARAAKIRSGFQVALVGPPNAGKSSLLNALSRSEAAIVTDQAGTTRDVVRVPLDLWGYRVELLDTAGLRDANDAIEAEGIRRAWAAAGESDLTLLCVDGRISAPDVLTMRGSIEGETLILATKSDLFSGRPDWAESVVSAQTGEGLAALERQ